MFWFDNIRSDCVVSCNDAHLSSGCSMYHIHHIHFGLPDKCTLVLLDITISSKVQQGPFPCHGSSTSWKKDRSALHWAQSQNIRIKIYQYISIILCNILQYLFVGWILNCLTKVKSNRNPRHKNYFSAVHICSYDMCKNTALQQLFSRASMTYL